MEEIYQQSGIATFVGACSDTGLLKYVWWKILLDFLCDSSENFFFILLIMLLELSHFPPFTPLHPAHPLPPTFPPIVHVHGSYL